MAALVAHVPPSPIELVATNASDSGDLAGTRAGHVDKASASVPPIPLVVYITSNSPDLSGPLADLWERNRAFLPPGTTVRHFNEMQRALSVKAISAELEAAGVVTGAYEAYKSLRPGSYLADMWRYMILWQNGGIYVDDKIGLTRNLTDWMNVLDSPSPAFWLTLDRPVGFPFQAFLASTPREEHVATIIRWIVQHVANHTYFPPQSFGGFADLMLTGPGALALALDVKSTGDWAAWRVTAFGNESPDAPGAPKIVGRFSGDGVGIVGQLRNGTTALVTRTDEALHHDPRYVSNLTYADFFYRHEVYCDEPGPPCLQLP